MISCSIGKINSAIIHKSLSGYTHVDLVVPLYSYSDYPKFDITIDSVKTEYTTVSSEVYMQANGGPVMRVSGILSSQVKWVGLHPTSFENSKVSDILGKMGIENGPNVQTSMLNLFLTDGQLAVVLANMSTNTAFINFDSNRVEYYSDLYKQKPLKITDAFRQVYVQPVGLGSICWDDTANYGNYTTISRTAIPIGRLDNINRIGMDNIVNNFNNITRILSTQQFVTTSYPLDIGQVVVSNLTYDKKVIVACEEHYDSNDELSAIYYCV